jgi:hypothetical protein
MLLHEILQKGYRKIRRKDWKPESFIEFTASFGFMAQLNETSNRWNFTLQDLMDDIWVAWEPQEIYLNDKHEGCEVTIHCNRKTAAFLYQLINHGKDNFNPPWLAWAEKIQKKLDFCKDADTSYPNV